MVRPVDLPPRPARDADAPALPADVRAVLEGVADPEVPVLSVIDLGIVRGVRREGATLVVTITPTYVGCPATAVIGFDVARALDAAGLGPVRVEQALAPAWTTDWMSPAGREKLRAYGIAPPGAKACGADPDEPPACPRCASTDTARISAFGSTACKALWRCNACLEPFDQFKCI